MNILKIRDLNTASMLKVKGFKLLDIEWLGERAYWVFENTNNRADELIQSYINGNIIGNLKKFAEAQKTLRVMLFK